MEVEKKMPFDDYKDSVPITSTNDGGAEIRVVTTESPKLSFTRNVDSAVHTTLQRSPEPFSAQPYPLTVSPPNLKPFPSVPPNVFVRLSPTSFQREDSEMDEIKSSLSGVQRVLSSQQTVSHLAVEDTVMPQARRRSEGETKAPSLLATCAPVETRVCGGSRLSVSVSPYLRSVRNAFSPIVELI
jgi:hypothetical protein